MKTWLFVLNFIFMGLVLLFISFAIYKIYREDEMFRNREFLDMNFMATMKEKYELEKGNNEVNAINIKTLDKNMQIMNGKLDLLLVHFGLNKKNATTTQ